MAYTIAILEGAEPDIFSRNPEVLGWPKMLRPSKIRKKFRKITRPIRKITAPITRPLDRVLKKTPVVRTVYRANIAKQHAQRLQIKKAAGATKRTVRAAKRDFVGAKRLLTKTAIKIVTPLAKSGMSKIAAKITAIPTVSAFASAQLGPWSIPLVGAAVNTAINQVWAKIKRALPKSASNMIKRLVNPDNALDQFYPANMPPPEPAKTGVSIAPIAALIAIPFLMG